MNDLVQKGVLTAVVLTSAFFGVRYFLSDDRDQRDLLKKKVNFDKNKLPHYTLATVKEYAIKAQKGELVSWGASQFVPINVYNQMVENKMDAIYWTPNNLIAKAYKEMKGVQLDIGLTLAAVVSPLFFFIDLGDFGYLSPRDKIFTEISELNNDQLRYFHNKWIELAAEGDSFYDWVDGEYSNATIKNKLLSRLSAAGVGKYINK